MIAIGSFVLIATAGRCEDLVVRIYSRRFWASFASGHSVAWIVDLASGISTVPTSSKRKEGKPDDRGRVSVVSFSQRRLLEKKDLDALARIIPIVDR
jgi:hypothetical protein